MRINESKLTKIIKECLNEVISDELKGYGISKEMNQGAEDIREGGVMTNNDPNYTHYAVNKGTMKIVNGWDYTGYDPSELRQFKKDYFIVDLMDMELDPKQYTILTKKSLLQKGINPDDNASWANQ
jgi:hypothetical protein